MAAHLAVGRSTVSVAPWLSCPSLGQRNEMTWEPGAGIMEIDDRQVKTIFIVQPTFHHRHSTNRVS